MADACVFLLENVDFVDILKVESGEIRNTHINIGTGKDVCIKEFTELIKKVVGYTGELFFNTQKPDGMMFKLTNSSRLCELG